MIKASSGEKVNIFLSFLFKKAYLLHQDFVFAVWKVLIDGSSNTRTRLDGFNHRVIIILFKSDWLSSKQCEKWNWRTFLNYSVFFWAMCLWDLGKRKYLRPLSLSFCVISEKRKDVSNSSNILNLWITSEIWVFIQINPQLHQSIKECSSHDLEMKSNRTNTLQSLLSHRRVESLSFKSFNSKTLTEVGRLWVWCPYLMVALDTAEAHKQVELDQSNLQITDKITEHVMFSEYCLLIFFLHV